MADAGGRHVPLSLPRRWIVDLLHASRHVPLVVIERRMDLSRPAAARSRLREAPGWCALFTSAFARVAASRPQFRQCYLPNPWPRLYEHPFTVASVAVEREFRGEPAIFFGLIHDPARRDLAEVEARVRCFKEGRIDENAHFRALIRLARLPRALRRPLWSLMLHWSGPAAARNAGTFGVSATASLGSAAVRLISPLAFTLSYSPLDQHGGMVVRLHFDHRVIDGGPAARGLAEMEDVLTNDLTAALSEPHPQDPPLARSAPRG